MVYATLGVLILTVATLCGMLTMIVLEAAVARVRGRGDQ